MQTKCKNVWQEISTTVRQGIFATVRQGIFATMVPTCVYFCVVFKNVFGKNEKANAQMSKDIQ